MIGSDDNRSFVRNVFAANGLQTEKMENSTLKSSCTNRYHMRFISPFSQGQDCFRDFLNGHLCRINEHCIICLLRGEIALVSSKRSRSLILF